MRLIENRVRLVLHDYSLTLQARGVPADLRREFPEMKGFSARNLKYMRLFAETWTDGQFVQQVVAQIPWGHKYHLVDQGQG